jgi:hypothetical protein
MRVSRDVARYRGQLGGIKRAQRNGERPENAEEITEAERKLKEAKATDYIRRLVDEAPEFTADQRARLAELLAPVRRVGGA